MRKAAPQVWRGLTRGLLRRQELGPQGMREAHALDHLTSTVLDLRSDLYFAGLARGQGDFDIQRWVLLRPQTVTHVNGSQGLTWMTMVLVLSPASS